MGELSVGSGADDSLSFAEILDFGYPQNSETGALKTFITQQGIKSQVPGFYRLCAGCSLTSLHPSWPPALPRLTHGPSLDRKCWLAPPASLLP